MESDKQTVCNVCGAECWADDPFGINVETHWGYESTGKDLSSDKWHACRNCRDKVLLRLDPVCAMCQRPIGAVMADLDVANPGCIHTTVAGSREWQRGGNFCGHEYATINGHQVCEVCYEHFLSTLKVPAKTWYRAVSDEKGGGERTDWEADRMLSTVSEDSLRAIRAKCAEGRKRVLASASGPVEALALLEDGEETTGANGATV